MRRGALILAVPAIVAVSAQEIPRFKSGVDVVQFTVTVLDKDRHPIAGLTPSDFEVLVDGNRRPLAAFAAVNLPDDASMAVASTPVAPDIHTNRLPTEGRLVVIVMDRSTPIGQPMHSARTIANAAIDRLGPDDLAAVVLTSTSARKYSQGLTGDRTRLHAAVANAIMGVDTSKRIQLASEEQSGECPCGVCVVDTLTALAKALAIGTVRHKSILFVGSDIALVSRNHGSTCESRIQSARERLSRALDEANVIFNAVDPRGLEALGESAENAGPVANSDRDTNVFREQSLAVLPDDTGGRVVLNTNTPEAAVGPIFDESRTYYVMAVERDSAGLKDDRHQVKIAVKRSGAIVSARKVYFTADPKAKAERVPNTVTEALNELLPGGDFPLRMNLVPEFAPDGSPRIRVLLGADSSIAGKLDVLIRAYDRVFTPAGDPIKQRLDVPANAVAGSATFQWTSILKPPPGDYEVRAAVATADGRHAANVIGYVDVPDVQKQGLALSGISVKSGGGATVQREFNAGAAIGLAFQVARAKGTSGAATVRYALRKELGQVLANADVPKERAVASAPNVDAYDVGLRLPTAPGRYVLTIEAGDGRRTARREVPLTVR